MPNRHRMATLLVASAMVLATVACVPPSTSLPGEPSWHTLQRLLVLIADAQGHQFECTLYHDATWDLGYTTVRVTSRTYSGTESWCHYSDWRDTAAVGSCSIGTGNPLNCGAGWSLPVGPTNDLRVFDFVNPPPNFGTISVLFQSVLQLPSGLGPFPVSISGTTPPIRCSAALQQCKFQP